jgi:hypothetical protein
MKQRHTGCSLLPTAVRGWAGGIALLVAGSAGRLVAQTPSVEVGLTLGQVHLAVEAATPRMGAAGALAPAAEARIALARRLHCSGAGAVVSAREWLLHGG